MAWSTPKTDWGTNNPILDSDLNRIEGNTAFLAGAEGTVSGTIEGFDGGVVAYTYYWYLQTTVGGRQKVSLFLPAKSGNMTTGAPIRIYNLPTELRPNQSIIILFVDKNSMLSGVLLQPGSSTLQMDPIDPTDCKFHGDAFPTGSQGFNDLLIEYSI